MVLSGSLPDPWIATDADQDPGASPTDDLVSIFGSLSAVSVWLARYRFDPALFRAGILEWMNANRVEAERP